MKPFWKRLITLLFVICLQICLVPYLSRPPFFIDLVLIYLFYFGFYVDQIEAGILGVIGGFLRDAFAHSYFGLSALVYGLAGFLAGFFRRLLVHYPVVAFSYTVWSGTFSVYFFYYFLLYLFGFRVGLSHIFAVSLGTAFANFLIAALVSMVVFSRLSEAFSKRAL